MIHQIAADLVTGIRNAVRRIVAARYQEQLGNFDRMRGEYERPGRRTVIAAIGVLVSHRGDSPVTTDLDAMNDRPAR